MPRQVKIADGVALLNPFTLVQVQQVNHGSATALSAQLRQVVDFLPENLSPVGEEQQVRVRAGHEQMFDRILVFRLRPFQAFASPALSAIGAGRGPLDVAAMADRNHHRLFRDQILQVDRSDFLTGDLRSPLVTTTFLDLTEIVFDDVQDILIVSQDAKILGDFIQQLAEFLAQPLLLEIDQLPQGHPQDRVRLDRGQHVFIRRTAFILELLEPVIPERPLQHGRGTAKFDQSRFCVLLCLRRPDDLDDFVDVCQCQQ